MCFLYDSIASILVVCIIFHPAIYGANSPKILGKSQASEKGKILPFYPIPQFLADYPAAIIIADFLFPAA